LSKSSGTARIFIIRSRSSAVKRFIFARLTLVNKCPKAWYKDPPTYFETRPEPALEISLESHEKVALYVQHQDALVLQIRSSRIEFVGG
jgi:hypothetical protein